MSILNLRKSQDKLPKKPRSIKNKLVKAVLFWVSLSVWWTLWLVGTEHLKRKNYDKQTKKEMLKKWIPNNNAKYSWKWPYEDVPFKNWWHDLIWLQEDYIISIWKILKINNIKNSQSILKIIGSIMASEDLLSKDFTVNLRLITDSITDRKLPFIKEFSKSALKVKSWAHEIISKDYELEFISRLADFVIFDKWKKIKLWEHLKKDSKEEFISDFKSGKISTKWPTWFAIWVLMLEYIFEQDYKSSQKINIETLYALYEQKSARRFYKTDLEYLKYANNIDTEKSAITDFRKKINEDLSEIKKQIFLLNINNKKKNLLAWYVDKLINNPTLNIKVVRNKINSVKIIKEKGKEKGKSKKIKAKINQLFLQIESTKNKIPKTRNELIKTKKQENAYWAKIWTVRKDFMQGIYNILNWEDFICARLVSQYAVNINKFRAISLEQFDLNLAIINDNFKNDKDQKLLIIDWIKW
jgi:predicted DNA-binding protein YlxM (UPF0122 family)